MLARCLTCSARCSALLLLAALTSACGQTLEIGSNVMWATDHESGKRDDWYADGKGGLLSDSANSTVDFADGPAHSGRYSLALTDLAMSEQDGPAIYRE